MSEPGKGILQTGPNARQEGFAGDLSQMEAPHMKEWSRNEAGDQGPVADVGGQEVRGKPINRFSEDQFMNMPQGNQGRHHQNFL
uniref:Uncharacterized protein n=1 Tax=Acrobeloides nanus TaxID=290746 RepID=A0A914CSP8_9BILA